LTPGVLIECDPSVKAIILKYDEERHDYIVEDLDDDRHLVIKESQLQNLKIRLGRVSGPLTTGWMMGGRARPKWFVLGNLSADEGLGT
jgi:TFIIH basal transcription factor complex TTD-A subunit